MGLTVMTLGLLLFLGVHTLTAARIACATDRFEGRGRIQDRLFASFVRRVGANRVGLCSLSCSGNG